MSSNSAKLALDLVGYPNEVQAAMNFVFGSTFICPDEATAKAVTFNKDIRMRSVTVQGDVYNPGGTLEGGSAPSSAQILLKAQQLKQLTNQLAESKQQLADIEKSFAKAQEEMASFRKLKEDFDLKKHEVNELEGRVADSSSTRVSISNFYTMQILNSRTDHSRGRDHQNHHRRAQRFNLRLAERASRRGQGGQADRERNGRVQE